MVIETDTLFNLATAYKGYGSNVGLATGSCGTSSTANSEASGSGYARVGTTWGTVSSNGTVTGSAVTITVGAATYTYVLLASGSSTASASMYDNNTITNVTMGATGSIVVTPTYTQT